MTILNLTQHLLTVLRADGSTVTFPPSGNVSRVSSVRTKIEGFTIDGIEMSQLVFGDVTGLPESNHLPHIAKEDYVFYIVSAQARQTYPERFDLLSPGQPVREEGSGKKVACIGFDCNGKPPML